MTPVVSLVVGAFARSRSEARALMREARNPVEDAPRGRRRRPWRMEIGIYCLRQVLERPGTSLFVFVGAAVVYLFLLAELAVHLLEVVL